jgi:hypothetical protein
MNKNRLVGGLIGIIMGITSSCGGEGEESIYDYPDYNTTNDTEQVDNDSYSDNNQTDNDFVGNDGNIDNDVDEDIIKELPTQFSSKKSPIYFLNNGKIFKKGDNIEVLIEKEDPLFTYTNKSKTIIVCDDNNNIHYVFSNGNSVKYSGESIKSNNDLKIVYDKLTFVKNDEGLYKGDENGKISKIVEEPINNLDLCEGNPIWDNNEKIFTYDLETEEISELKEGTNPYCNSDSNLFYQKDGKLFKEDKVYSNETFSNYKTVENKSEAGCEKEIFETGKQEHCIENDFGVLGVNNGLFTLINGNKIQTYDSGCEDVNEFSLQRWFEDYEDSSKVCFAYNCDGEGRATILDPKTGDYETIKVADNVETITWENQ